jgi:hypothetical protein
MVIVDCLLVPEASGLAERHKLGACCRPRAGLAVLAAYTAVALAGATWLLRHRIPERHGAFHDQVYERRLPPSGTRFRTLGSPFWLPHPPGGMAATYRDPAAAYGAGEVCDSRGG